MPPSPNHAGQTSFLPGSIASGLTKCFVGPVTPGRIAGSFAAAHPAFVSRFGYKHYRFEIAPFVGAIT